MILIESGGDNLAATFTSDLVGLLDLRDRHGRRGRHPAQARPRACCRPTCSWSTRPTSRRTSAPTSSGCGPTWTACARSARRCSATCAARTGPDEVYDVLAHDALFGRVPARVTRVHQDGLLDLRLRCDGRRRTVLAARRQRFPLRMTVPMYLDDHDPGMAFVYVQNPTGGVFAGDRLAQRVAAGPGTRVHVTTQSATKLYRADGGHAEQRAGLRRRQRRLPRARARPADPAGGGGLRPAHGGDAGAGRRLRRRRDGRRPVAARTASATPTSGSAWRPSCRDEDGRELVAETLELVPRRRAPGHPRAARRPRLPRVAAGRRSGARRGRARRPDRRARSPAARRPAPACCPAAPGVVARALRDGAPAAARALRAAWALAREELLGLPLPRLRK